MSINKLNDIGKSISKGAESAINKSEELFLISKIMFEISREEAEIKDCYEKIGEKLYKQSGKGEFVNKDFREYFNTIDKAKKRIKELKKKIDKIKNIEICLKCGCEIKKNSKYCPECGLKQ